MKNFFNKIKSWITRSKKNKIISILILILILFGIFKLISSLSHKNDSNLVSNNQIVELKKGDVTNSVTEKGEVVPSNSVEVFAEKSLPVTNVNVKVGDKVKKGDVLCELDSSSLEQQIKSRKAQKSATDKSVSAQISAAKKRLSEAISGRDSGKNSAIVAAETSLTQAMDQYLAAQKAYDDFKRSIDERYNEGIVAERNTRENLAYQEKTNDLKYKQLKEDMNRNIEKISENRSLASESARDKNYLQDKLDDLKRELTEIGLEIGKEQNEIADLQSSLVSTSETEHRINSDSGDDTEDKKNETSDNKEKRDKVNEKIKKSRKRIDDLTRNQNEIELEISNVTEELGNARSDEEKYKSEADAIEKELEEQNKQVESTKLEVEKTKDDIYQDADKVLKAQKARDDQLKTLEQNVETAKNNYDDAKKNLESTKVQVENEISSLSDNLKTAKASANNVDNVEIENLTEELEKVLIKAPADGTVTKVEAKEGQVPTVSVAKIETIDTLRIESQVKEYDKNNIKVGTEVEITSDSAMGETFKGKVISIDPVPKEESPESKSTEVYYKTVIEIDENSSEKFSPGMTLRVKYILSQKKDTFKVPTDAIFERDGKDYILVLKDAGKDNYEIQKIQVKKGIANDVETAITSDKLKDGIKVLSNAGGYGEGSIIKIDDTPQEEASDEK